MNVSAPPVVAPIVKKVFNVDEEESEKKRSRPLVPLTYTGDLKLISNQFELD